MGNSQQLFQSLFKKDLSSHDAKDFLTQLTKEHPYFTAAHFFLLKQKALSGANFEKEAATTSLLFNNSLWLNFQLDHTFKEESARYPVFKNIVKNEDVEVEVNNDLHANNVNIEELSEPIFGENTSGVTEVQLPIEEVEETTTVEEKGYSIILPEEEIPETNQVIEEVEEITAVEKETIASSLSEEQEISTLTEVQPAIEEVKEAIETEESNTTILSKEEEISTLTEVQLAIEEVKETTFTEEKEIPATHELSNDRLDEFTAAVKEESNMFTLPKFVLSTEDEDGTDNFTEEDFENDVEDAEIEPMNIKLNFTNINTTEDTIAFEPLHVSDYFTSVGIKLTDEVKPGDKLGKQLKSFTQWLKTMKKVHIEQLQEETAENNDLIIQQMAEKSNKEGETLTEAMAEVLSQQGKVEKAIEVYQKLSLLNPVKSAYFAAKINQIS